MSDEHFDYSKSRPGVFSHFYAHTPAPRASYAEYRAEIRKAARVRQANRPVSERVPKLLELLKRHGDWMPAGKICEAMRPSPARGIYNLLADLTARGVIERSKSDKRLGYRIKTRSA